jgi:hypothetical protein
MRRPAHNHRTGPAAPGWAHPYTGLPSIAVFYNDGGQSPAAPPPPPAPSPADLANRAPQPPAAPPAAGTDVDTLIDNRTGGPMTQATFTRIMAKENAKGRRAAMRELAEKAGITFPSSVSTDPEDADIDRLAQVLQDAETARQAQLSDDQRRSEELAAREKALQDREAAATQREAEALRKARDVQIRAALVSLGATGDDLEDAARLLTVPDDATDEQITQAATELKERRSVLFGTSTPQTLPPAPSGGPAGGNQPRQPAPAKDAIKEEAKRWADRLGYGGSSSAA